MFDSIEMLKNDFVNLFNIYGEVLRSRNGLLNFIRFLLIAFTWLFLGALPLAILSLFVLDGLIKSTIYPVERIKELSSVNTKDLPNAIVSAVSVWPIAVIATLCYSFTVFMLVWDYLAKGAVNLVIVISTLSMNKLYEKKNSKIDTELYT